MRLKITSDGTPRGTTILSDDGTSLGDLVSALSWRHDAGNLPVLEATLGLIELEVDGQARVLAPSGKAVRRIEYDDGSVDEFGETPTSVEAAKSLALGNPAVRHIR